MEGPDFAHILLAALARNPHEHFAHGRGIPRQRHATMISFVDNFDICYHLGYIHRHVAFLADH
jgi:hypothetical protein